MQLLHLGFFKKLNLNSLLSQKKVTQKFLDGLCAIINYQKIILVQLKFQKHCRTKYYLVHLWVTNCTGANPQAPMP